MVVTSKTLSKKKNNLKLAILNHASEQFRLHGLKAVKMDGIAAQMRISKRTLYEVYSNKEQIIVDSIRRYSERVHLHMEEYARTTDNVMDLLVEFFRYQAESYASANPLYFKELSKHPGVEEAMQEYKLRMNEHSLRFFELGVEEGYFNSSVTYPLLVELAQVCFRELRVNPVYEKYKPHEIFRSFVCVIIRGFCTQKGIDKIDEFLNRVDEEYNRLSV